MPLVKVGIIGAGIAGLTAGYELAQERHKVTIYEAAEQAGGLASGFRDPMWEWPLERFYHHVFETDTAIRKLTSDIGYGNNLFFRKGVTAHFWQNDFYPIAGPSEVLRFPGIPFIDRLRFGMAGFYLKYVTNDWQRLEGITANQWTKRWMGKAAYEVIMRPLLEGKFGPHATEVNMAWLWARLKARSFKLGYYTGGFQGFVDALQTTVQNLGGTVHLQAPVQKLEPTGKGWTLHSTAGSEHYDQVIVTGSPGLLAKLAPQLPADYLGKLATLKSMGAVVLVLALKQQLTKNHYWIQGMLRKNGFPFLALVEHTNFIEAEHYGGDHLIYCGDYLPADHEYFRMSKEELLVQFLPAIKRFNNDFAYEWIRKTWIHREPYAQPIVGLNHSKNIPPLATPLPNLYWASMSQVYPWDRGTNFAVELGQRVAKELLTK